MGKFDKLVIQVYSIISADSLISYFHSNKLNKGDVI